MHDLRLAIRALRAAPVVSLVAVLSLALGIGANTAIFTVVNALLLRPLPVMEPERLATISSAYALRHGFKAGVGWNASMWEQLQMRADAFGGALAWAPARFNLARGGEVQPAEGLFVSGEFFAVLGVRPRLGRMLTKSDDVTGGSADGAVGVISDRLWRRRFDAAMDVVGKPIILDGTPVTIVGVAPEDFSGVEVGRPFDVAVPLGTELLIRGSRSTLRKSFLLTVMLRLKRGQSIEEGTSTIQAMQPQILGVSPGELGRVSPGFLREPYMLVPAATGTADQSGLRRQFNRPLLTLFAVVALVLLIACVNIANLLLARATARRHELSMRAALGAPRWRLARQLLVESLVLSALGAWIGLIFAGWASRAVLPRLASVNSPMALNLPLDWRVLLFTTAAAALTAVLFGTAPAFRAARVAPADALKDQGRGTAAAGTAGLSSALVVAQVALSLVLVVAAGLFVRTFQGLANAPLGFDGNAVLLIEVDTGRAHRDGSTRLAYYQRLADVVGAVPGVSHAAASALTPLSAASNSPVLQQPDVIPRHVITPGWLAVYGTRILAGRALSADDVAGSAPVVIVNEAYVRKFFGDGAAIGKIVDDDGKKTVVGVVADAVFGSIRAGMRPTLYVPMAQAKGIGPPDRTTITLSVRPAGQSPASLAPAVGAALTTLDPQLDFTFGLLADDVRAALRQERLLAWLAGFFGALGLLLAALGLYGVTAYGVARRRTEIGIRLALGAVPGGIVRLVLSRVAWLVASGIAVGALGSVWLSQFVAALLYGLEPRDPVILAVAAVVLAATGLIAGWLPASRASGIQPAEVLRDR